jgi:hypothetical protein
VKIDFCEYSEVNKGVGQGDLLSETLSGIVIDKIIRKLDVRNNISTRLKQARAYADYVLILAISWHGMVDTLLKLKHEAEIVGFLDFLHRLIF